IGVIGGLIATTLALGGDEAIARSASEPPTATATLTVPVDEAPGSAAIVILAPAIAPIAIAQEPVLVTPPEVAPAAVKPAPAKTVPRTAAKQPVTKRRAVVQRTVAPKAKPATATAEDLYDTR
ncbi:MAG: hypothetical protein H0T79_06875, partial [Deltaproteobacteria bacterium]|nr:hypothetical protein [Deltaproteobacteria bacterium]